MGAMGLVRDPVRGAQADGAKGLVRGIGSGVFGVVLKPAKGVAKAGFNVYAGVRIGVSKAGRVVAGGGGGGAGGGGSRGGSAGSPSAASKVCAEFIDNRGNDANNHVCVQTDSRMMLV